nr:YcgN family cysteine cluster protein [uncultured Gellertiella sp.]
MTEAPFWKARSLEELDPAEWESLCDGCGLCCLNKLEDWDTGDVVFTCIGCRLLDGDSCRCSSYENRQTIVEDCIQLTPEEVRSITWLPPTCGYRLVRDGEDLKWWHPLISGDPETVHEAGISVRGRTVSESAVKVEDFEDYVVDWPLTVGG